MPRPQALAPMSRQDRTSTLRRLVSYLTEHRLWIVTAVITGLLGVGLSVAGPKILGQATNVLFSGLISAMLAKWGYSPDLTHAQIVTRMRQAGGMQASLAQMVSSMDIDIRVGMDWSLFGRILVLAIIVYVVAVLLRVAENWFVTRIIVKMVYRMRGEIEHKLHHLRLSYFDGVPRGEIMSRTTNDVDNITGTLQQMLGELLFSVFTVIAVFVMMFSISWQLTLITLVVIPVIFLVGRLFTRRAEPYFGRLWSDTGTVNSDVEEMFSGHLVVRAFSQQKNAEKRFDEENRRLYESTYRSQLISGLVQPVSGFLTNAFYVLIIVVGGAQVLAGNMSLGDFQAFTQYSRQASQPITQIASMTTQLQSALASCKRIFDFLDAPEEQPDPQPGARLSRRTNGAIDGHVVFNHVRFSYDPDNPLIEDLSIEAKPGQTVAIVGPTGAGKTTLVNLLMRFYEIQGGHIYVDGTDTKRVTRHELRSHFGMVLQDTWLFDGTIRDNLLYGVRPGQTVSQEQMLEAAKATYVDEFVRRLPKGYDTVVSADSEDLSQGERQLLTICRAFLSRPDILILDEATSSVDTRTEMLVQQAMGRLREGRTSFVIAHRLSTIVDADLILYVNHGSVIEQGTHQELLAKGGAYARLYNSQFAGVADEDED
jgi:ATP-binding cassette subfamily B multidrug efflux pump